MSRPVTLTLLFYAPNDNSYASTITTTLTEKAPFWTVRVRDTAPSDAGTAAQRCLHVIGSDLRVMATQIVPRNFWCGLGVLPVVRIYTRRAPHCSPMHLQFLLLGSKSLARSAAFIEGLTPQRLELYAYSWRNRDNDDNSAAAWTRARARRACAKFI